MRDWIEQHGLGPATIEQGKSGQFDIVAGGTLAYSRYETGRFPSPADLEALRGKLAAGR